MPVQTKTRTDVEQAIRELANEYAARYNRRDAQGVSTLFTSDGVSNPPFQEAAKGPATIRKAQDQQFQELDPKNLKIETDHVEAAGELGFSFGRYTMNVKTPDGKRLDDRGKWVCALRQESGNWRVVANCWNSDLKLTA